ncbi:esterase-like activity of phytase family protein [Nocardia sp. NPDC059180]|uniref:esterase-like activity of phytase family protein n=1 Tax=Nocardia sp. NPDC059180 TaxID=3346761 RepID=UPI0036B51FB1
MAARGQMIRRQAAVAATVAATLGLAPGASAAPGPAVRLLGEQLVPFGLDFQGTVVGGLSGIDYRPSTGEYVLISDDRSDRASARFYTARIGVDEHGVHPVTFTATHSLRTADGAEYPRETVDPEEIRVDPLSGEYFWSQEGSGTVYPDPSVRIARPDGTFAGELPIPNNERVLPDSGPRPNSVLEGASFAAGGSLFVTAVEGPLHQDGPEATVTSGALSRITVQTRFGPVLAQYAYPMEPVFAESSPGPGRGGNGIASILAVDSLNPAKFLVLERAYVDGAGNKVRIFEADLSGATNILDAPIDEARPVSKRLLVDLADVGLSTIDNVEGMTWGPRLPSGDRTLVLVSDNNFSDRQITQVIALAVPD